MSRNKNPELTVTRILNAAQKLFLQKGYEHTTMQDIVDELGNLSKGAIYHHFKSKEDIIDAVVTRFYQNEDPIERVSSMDGLNGLEKIKMILTLSVTDNSQIDMVKISPTLFRNPKFLAVQMNDCLNKVAPCIRKFIEEGNEDGSLNIEYPRQVSEYSLLLLNMWLTMSLFESSCDECLDNARSLRILFDGVGLPVIDDLFINQLGDLYNKLHS